MVLNSPESPIACHLAWQRLGHPEGKSTAMDWYVWLLLGGLVVLVLYILRDRARAKAEIGLSPDELRKKRALEDMADNSSP